VRGGRVDAWPAPSCVTKSVQRKAANGRPSKPGKGGGARKRGRRSPFGGWGWPLAAIVGALLILAVLRLSFGGGGGATGQDFGLVAYQGDPILGGHNSTFSKVFAQQKPVVLNFWAGNCPSCRLEMPGFQTVSREFAGKVIFVGVDVGPYTNLGTHEDAVNLYRELGITYPLAYAVDASPLQFYNVQGMPTSIFLTPAGQVADRVTGILTEDQLRSEIQQKLLAAT